MSAPNHLLSVTDDELRILREVLDRSRKTPINTLPDVDLPIPNQAPEVYIAKIPPEGIPPLDEHGSGDPTDDEPGQADCDIYKISPTNRMVSAGFSKPVYNFSKTKIDGPYQAVARDKYGKWLAINSGKGGGGAGICFTLTSSFEDHAASATVDRWWGRDPGTGTGTPLLVYDTFELFIRALPEAAGIAIWDDENEAYRVVQCETKAGWIVATVDSIPTVLSVDDWGGTKQDVLNPTSGTGSTPDISDPAGIVPNAFGTSGDSFTVIAILDVAADEYKVISCKPAVSQAIFIQFTLTGALSGATASASIENYFQGTNPGGSTTVHNQSSSDGYMFSGAAGAEGIAVWDDLESVYRIIQLECPASGT